LTAQRRQQAEATGVVGAAPQPQNTQPPPEPVAPLKKAAAVERRVDAVGAAVSSVEEFVPDAGAFLDNSFLEDLEPSASAAARTALDDSDSEPEVSGNPLVAGFQDDVDEEESFGTRPDSGAEEVRPVQTVEDDASEEDIKEDWLLPGKTRRSSPEGREEAKEPPEVKLGHFLEPDKVEKTKKSKEKVNIL